MAYACSLLFLVKRNSSGLRQRSRVDQLIKENDHFGGQPEAAQNVSRSSGPRKSSQTGILSKITVQLSQAGIHLKAQEYLLIWMLSGVLFPVLCFLISRSWIVALGIAVFGLLLPPLAVSHSQKKRTALFEAQLLDALVVIGNCLRAGFTFQQAIGNIAQEMPEPISREFGKVIREMKLGISMEAALQEMVKRLQNDDLELLVQAVLIQKQVGGNLADILDNIAGTIRERLRLKGEIKVLTSSGKISGFIIGLLPVFLLAFLMVTNPSYVSMFFHTTVGILMLVFALCMEITGFLIIRKIVNIKF